MRRLLVAITIVALSGVPALGAVCVTACLPAVDGGHHAVAVTTPVQEAHAPVADAAHHHAHDTASPAAESRPVPADAAGRLNDGADCPCCTMVVTSVVPAQVVPRIVPAPDTTPAVAHAGPDSGRGAGPSRNCPPVAVAAVPPESPPASPPVLRL